MKVVSAYPTLVQRCRICLFFAESNVKVLVEMARQGKGVDLSESIKDLAEVRKSSDVGILVAVVECEANARHCLCIEERIPPLRRRSFHILTEEEPTCPDPNLFAAKKSPLIPQNNAVFARSRWNQPSSACESQIRWSQQLCTQERSRQQR